ncbi:hypothetical protein NQ315_014861 [Exocentrus adspersus]|uniref:PiggyBac transposable element-derived protein domain-containing protein n=1 Tax=Exocentrus adspersus TaxID=1586481 RepID=A0AAV8VKR9_9CUCU|nr:hypothetical protein NQ315_014861 [Exocentrus adspersus]
MDYFDEGMNLVGHRGYERHIKEHTYEDYWSNNTRIEQIASLMSVKRFKSLRRLIHFNNNDDLTESTTDRYFKIHPLIEMLRQNFRKYHTENQYSVDETMAAYKGTRAGNLRQYVKNKPHKWGYKFFVIGGVSGYILDLIPYQGANTFQELKGTVNEVTQTECDMGVGAGIVIALSKSLHDPGNSTLFFDIYFASLPLFIYLKEKNEWNSLGTLCSNRIAGCPIEPDKVMLKQGRGKYDYKTDREKGLIIVKWADNKAVCGRESRKRRPISEVEVPVATIKCPVVERPDTGSRTDCCGHWPVHTSKGRCRHCTNGTSRIKCEKCDSRLCLNDESSQMNKLRHLMLSEKRERQNIIAKRVGHKNDG